MIKEAFILNYDCGNFSSLKVWLNKAHISAYLIDNAKEFEQLTSKSMLILPGVGHFKTAHDSILKKQFKPALESIYGSIPILGICLGAQIMFESSAEAPNSPGLGWFNGHIEQLPPSQCPRLGWYDTRPSDVAQHNRVLSRSESFFYNHSYYMKKDLSDANNFKEYSLSSSNIIAGFVSTRRVIGIQYHPEKPQKIGQSLLNSIIKHI